ncbi:MAG: restriction endonuclease subunit S [Rickettsiales bacterium]|nr:restriction endonuclease subunit S [Rickettsiales bacterium]
MKPSNIEWIGDIPDDWKVAKYKFFAKSRMGETILASETKESGIPIYSATQDGKIFGYIDNPRVILKKGDIVIPARGNSIGCAALVEVEVATCTQTTICSCDIHDCLNKYLMYCCYGLKDWWFKYDGSAIPQITVQQVDNNAVPFPGTREQQRIADFLDKKCAEVDELIKNQEEQIEKLKAYKQAVITEAVTKGLDKSAPMKDSGVEWIGEINNGFTIKPIGILFKIKKDIIGHEPDVVLSITQTGIKPKDISSNEGQLADSYDHYQIVCKGDFAMNHMDLLTGWVDISQYNGVTSPDYRVFILKDKSQIAAYYLYVLQSYYKQKVFYGFGQGVAGMGRWRLPAENFKKIFIPVPRTTMQQQIVDYLDKKCSDIDKLIELKQQKIEKLGEYKKSLIYEYVTGKKEVV